MKINDSVKERVWASSIIVFTLIAVRATITTLQIIPAIIAILIYLYGKDSIGDKQLLNLGKLFYFISVIEIFFLAVMLVSMMIFGLEIHPD